MHISLLHISLKRSVFFVFLGSCCLLTLSFERKGTHPSPGTEKKRQVEVLSVCFFAVWSATRIGDARPQMGEVGAIWIILSHCGTLWNDIEVP